MHWNLSSGIRATQWITYYGDPVSLHTCISIYGFGVLVALLWMYGNPTQRKEIKFHHVNLLYSYQLPAALAPQMSQSENVHKPCKIPFYCDLTPNLLNISTLTHLIVIVMTVLICLFQALCTSKCLKLLKLSRQWTHSTPNV